MSQAGQPRRAKPRDHGTRGCYKHGEWGHEGEGCHCGRCTAANSRYEARRELLIGRGTWAPFTSAGPAQQRIAELAKKLSLRQIAQATGLARSTVCSIAQGQTTSIRTGTSRVILAVEPQSERLADRVLVDATGTQHRLQALVAAGHSQSSLAHQIGQEARNFTRIMKTSHVYASTDRAVRQLYSERWDQPPPQSTKYERAAMTRAIVYGRRMGWAPPVAWSDAELDRPGGRPLPQKQWRRHEVKQRRGEDLIEDATWIMRTEEGGLANAARRLGISQDGLECAFRRVRERKAAAAAGVGGDQEPQASVTVLPVMEQDADWSSEPELSDGLEAG